LKHDHRNELASVAVADLLKSVVYYQRYWGRSEFPDSRISVKFFEGGLGFHESGSVRRIALLKGRIRQPTNDPSA
jgi:hypothetical protein